MLLFRFNCILWVFDSNAWTINLFMVFDAASSFSYDLCFCYNEMNGAKRWLDSYRGHRWSITVVKLKLEQKIQDIIDRKRFNLNYPLNKY